VIQAPDIGKMILEHTADSHVIELPFGKAIHLPQGWLIPGTHIDVSPTKHVVFMIFASVLVFLTLWIAGRSVARRHREGSNDRTERARRADARPQRRHRPRDFPRR